VASTWRQGTKLGTGTWTKIEQRSKTEDENDDDSGRKEAVENGMITIVGERKFEREENKKYHRVERAYCCSFRGIANGSTEGEEWSTFVSGGYDFHFGHLTIGPIAALQYTMYMLMDLRRRAPQLP
jgi:hypothetical protein